MEYRTDAIFKKPSIFREGIREYSESSSTPVSRELSLIAEETARLAPEWADISTSSVQATFLQMLISSAGMRKVLEVGTFTGHGTVGMAAALPEDGEIATIDSYVTDARAQAIASAAFGRSSNAYKIEPIIDYVLSALQKIDGEFDRIFLDADKPNYIKYFEIILKRELLKPRGLMVVDKTLWGGEVLNPRNLPPAEEAATGEEWVERRFASWAHDVVKFNKYIAAGPRVRVVQLTVADGMTIVQLAQ